MAQANSRSIWNGASLTLAAALVLAGPALAQDAAPAQEPAPAGSHEQAARELFALVGGENYIDSAAESMLVMVRRNPEMAPFEDVYRTWIEEVLTEGDLESRVARIYVDAFSEAELRELTTFYRSPIGRKAQEVMPTVMRRSAEVSMQLVQTRTPELLERLERARHERHEAEAATPAAPPSAEAPAATPEAAAAAPSSPAPAGG